MENPQKSPKKYECITCNYFTSNKKDYNKHITTRKHKNRTLSNEKSPKIPKPIEKYVCEKCGKSYKVRNSYWYHIKKCEIDNNEFINIKNEPEVNDEYKKIISDVMEKNNELTNLLIEQQEQYNKNLQEILPRIGNTTHNTKNEVNLNIFLNEDCKDALNMVEFVNSLKIKMKDIENTVNCGYANGISQIFIEGLKALELHKRPLHCSDPINETLYIKDNNVWELDKDKNKIKNAIENVNKKSAQQMHNLLTDNQNNVDCENIISTIIDSDIKQGENDKIIKNIVKEVTITGDN